MDGLFGGGGGRFCFGNFRIRKSRPAGRFRPEKLKVGAFDSPVVDLSPAGCLLPDERFKIGPGGKDEMTPGGEPGKDGGDRFLEGAKRVLFAKAFAVGGIRNNAAVFPGIVQM